jgi:hypothetical protein
MVPLPPLAESVFQELSNEWSCQFRQLLCPALGDRSRHQSLKNMNYYRAEMQVRINIRRNDSYHLTNNRVYWQSKHKFETKAKYG